MAEFERRSDPVGWWKQVITILAAVVASTITGTSVVLWEFNGNFAAHTEIIKSIVARDNQLERGLKDLEKWRIEHTQWGYEATGRINARSVEIDRRIDRLESIADKQINHTHPPDRTYFEIMKGMEGNRNEQGSR
jgi:hypothetical protein